MSTSSERMAKDFAIVFTVMMGVIVGVLQTITGLHGHASEWWRVSKGLALILACLLVLWLRFRCKRHTSSPHSTISSRSATIDPLQKKRKLPNGTENKKHLPDLSIGTKRDSGAPVPPRKTWTPDHTKPQLFDFDNGECPYHRDSSKPLGSRENPVVVGIPESSTNLVFSTERGCWLLTDGLGNGFIR